MSEPMSATAFAWFISVMVGGVSALWLVYDSVNLARALKLDPANPAVRDRRFGYAMGLVMGLIGVIGTLKFHGVV